MSIFDRIINRRGQATTEVVLLFPIFFILTLFIIKIYGLLIIVQKTEIASFYAAKRWQLESHRAVKYADGWDNIFLKKDIEKKVMDYKISCAVQDDFDFPVEDNDDFDL